METKYENRLKAAQQSAHQKEGALRSEPKPRGKWITFEGIDGAGKSTQLTRLSRTLSARLKPLGISLCTTREPGGTPLGETVRKWLLHQPMQLETEVLLIFAARCEHLATVIRPALERGDWVLCDRFSDATFAYQGGGRGLEQSKIAALEAWVQGSLQPDLTVLFDIPVEIARARRGTFTMSDQFESESNLFFERVRSAYTRRALDAPHRVVQIDATCGIEEIHRTLEEIVAQL